MSFVTAPISYNAFSRVADNVVQCVCQRFIGHLPSKVVRWLDMREISTEMATRLTNYAFDFREGIGEKLTFLIQRKVLVPAGFVVSCTID